MKESMTSKERVMCALDFRKPDRMPIFENFWPEFEDVWHREMSQPPDADIYDYYGIDISIQVADETLLPTQRGEISRDGEYIISQGGWGAIIRSKEGGYFHEFVDTIIKTPEDLDNLVFDPADLDIRYAEFMEGVEKDREKRCVFAKIGGPFIRSSFARGETNWYMDLAGDPGFARALAERVGDHLMRIGLESLKRGNLWDTGIWIYDDMASNSGPLFSPKTFEDIFLPIYRRLVSTFKQAGAAKVILHSDGNIMPLLDMLLDAGIDGINPVEYKAGMDVARLREKYGNRLALIGGVDNAFILPGNDKEEIRRHITSILEAGRNGGVIAGAHSIAPDVPVEAYNLYNSLVRTFEL